MDPPALRFAALSSDQFAGLREAYPLFSGDTRQIFVFQLRTADAVAGTVFAPDAAVRRIQLSLLPVQHIAAKPRFTDADGGSVQIDQTQHLRPCFLAAHHAQQRTGP